MTKDKKICIIEDGKLSARLAVPQFNLLPSLSISRNVEFPYQTMRPNFEFHKRFLTLFLLLTGLVLGAAAQTAEELAFIEEAESGGGWGFTLFIVAAIGLGGAYYFWRKSKKGDAEPKYNYANRYSNHYRNETHELKGDEADMDMDLIRKSKQASAKDMTFGPKKSGSALAKKAMPAIKSGESDDLNFDAKIFQEKMRKLQYAQLPINSFDALAPAKLYEPLVLANDPSLINAIEQANEEFEEDESVRDLAVRILTAFRTRNSVDALSQIALYDLSANLRSKAVATLTEFDHESVFEAILLACADPTREVRAAAARGLFRLNFDRADAWTRIIETNDEFRMSHAARAAVEAGIVVKSFDRLVHEDTKVAYEAYALVALLIRTGETKEIFEAIRHHKDERVRFALLHVLKAQRDDRTLDELYSLQKDGSFPTDVADRIRETISSFDAVLA